MSDNSEHTPQSAAGGSTYKAIVYSLPHLSMTWLVAPIGVVQGIYAKYYGLSLTTIATILLVAKLFNAVTDPIIGYYADRYYQRSGTRKPFILIGGLLFIVTSYFLYSPPQTVTPGYFMAWFLAFYLAWTIIEVPHLVWGGEIAKDSVEKTKIYSFRSTAGFSGMLAFYSIPLLPFFATTEITPETLKVTVVAASVSLLLGLYFCLKDVPNGSVSTIPHKQKDSLVNALHSFIENKPYLLFLCAYLFTGFCMGLWNGLIFIYVDAYLQMGEAFAKMFLIALVFGIATMPVWYKIIVLVGKKLTWAIATLLLLVAFIYTGLLEPGAVSLTQLAILKVLSTAGYTCIGIVAPAMLSDIVDYGTWRYGREKGATYFAIYTFLTKTSLALATSLGLAIAGWYGFTMTADTQAAEGVFGIKLAIAWLPLLSGIIVLIFIYFSPINERRYAVIQRRMEALKMRSRRDSTGAG